MSKQTRITIEEHSRHNFKKLYDFLFIEPYINMSNDAKILYTLLRDRFSLSIKNKWTNDRGEIYLIYRNKDLMEIMQRSKPSIIKMKKELMKYNLLEEEKQVAKNNADLPNLLFLKAESDFIITDSIFQNNEETINDENTQNGNLSPLNRGSNNFTPPGKEFLPPQSKFFTPGVKILYPYSHTNISHTNINQNDKCLMSINYLANEELNDLFNKYLNMRINLYHTLDNDVERKKYFTDENQILSLLKRLGKLSNGSEFLKKKIILASLKNEWANFFEPNFHH